MIGDFVPGRSLLHRSPPGLKLLLLVVVVTVLGLWRAPVPTSVAVLALVTTHLVLRLPWRPWWPVLRWFLLFATLLAIFQVWQSGPARAVVIVGQLLVALLGGRLLMATTRVMDMVRTLARIVVPFPSKQARRDRVELLLALTIGCIPRVGRLVVQAREASLARGAGARPQVVLPSAVVRTVRQADDLAEAMAARGL